MSLTTSNGRRSAAGVPFLPLGPGIVPGSTPPSIRQQAGWGYSGLPVGAQAPVPTEVFHFVYRRDRRLRARKATA